MDNQSNGDIPGIGEIMAAREPGGDESKPCKSRMKYT